ncbi:terminase [Luteibacter sp. NPDC031894]|uniref:terminase n=1 Tax=Luteibacter sp. NPDC031894 TaxID=3390572 RepID=UPI003D075E46
MARPSTFKPEYVEQTQKLAALGATELEIAQFFGITERGFRKWKQLHPELVPALKIGKTEPDERVERSLFQRAVGYSFESEKVFQFQGEVVRTPVIEHVAPDTTACIFWLKNRRPDLWRDKREMEHSGNLTLESLVAGVKGSEAE